MIEEVALKEIHKIEELRGKKQFLLTDMNDREIICFNTTLHGQLEVGKIFQLDILPSKFENGRPMLTKIVTAESHQEPKSDMSKDDWAEKDRIKQQSIEAQKAVEMGFNLLLLSMGNILDFKPDPKTTTGKLMIKSVEKCLQWLGEPLVEEIKEKSK